MKLSQDQLAQKMEKSGKQIVSNWETDRSEPSISDLRKLAEILGTTASWLIDGGESPQTKVVQEVPPGYVLMPAEEVIEMQRQLIRSKDQTIKEKE